nr:VP1 [Kobuvirus cattle/Kagoshima-1-22-KoV/2014/JPN]
PQAGTDLDAQTSQSTIENGAPTSAPEERTTFQYVDAPVPPDTNLAAYFSFYRPIFISGNSYSVQLLSSIQVMELNPVDWIRNAGPGDTLPNLLSCFTYIRGDPRLSFRISNPASFAANITFFFIPPGGAVPSGAFTNIQLEDNYHVRCSVDPVSEQTVCLSIPYCNPLSAIPTSFMGFADFQGGNDIVNTTFGTVVITVEFQGSVPAASYPTIYAGLAFGNFAAWVPRSPPTTASAPSTASLAFTLHGEEEEAPPRRDPRPTALELFQKHKATHPRLPIALARRQ